MQPLAAGLATLAVVGGVMHLSRLDRTEIKESK